MRSDVFAMDLFRSVVFLVDFDLIGQTGNVRDIDFDRTITQRLHELIALELFVFGLVGVADDDLVDVGLGELLRFDDVLLGGAEQVVKKCHVQLEDLYKLDHASVGHIKLTIKVKGPWVGVGAIDGDLAVVDVAGQLGGVLVLLVLGLERADADAVLLRENESVNHNVL